MTRTRCIFFACFVISGITSSFSSAQVAIFENDTAFCIPQPVTFHAEADSSQISYGLTIADDYYSQIIDLEFPFTFYGNTYTQCLLSTNAYICFDLANAARKLSEPPQRDKSGKRVDIDGNRDFGYEIW